MSIKPLFEVIQVVEIAESLIAAADRSAQVNPRGALKAKRMHERRLRAQAKPDAVADIVQADPAKARVMVYFRELVAGGSAELHTLEDGTIRLRLNTGETYLLAKAAITRIA